MILDIGNEAIESIPLGTRFLNGLFQSFAVRAAGFAIVPLAATAPAVQFLYVAMMYVSSSLAEMPLRMLTRGCPSVGIS